MDPTNLDSALSATAARAARKRRMALLFGSKLVRGQMEIFRGLKDDFDLTVFLGRKRDSNTDSLDLPVINVPGLDNILPSVNRPFRFINRQLTRRGLHFCPQLERELKDFDLIYTSEPYTQWTRQVMRATRNSNAKIIVQSYENLPFRREGVIGCEWKTECYKRAHHFVAITQQAKDVMIAEGARPELISIVPSALDTNQFSPGPKDSAVLKMIGSSEDDITILFAGRLLWVKGIFDFVEAAKIVLDKWKSKQKLRFAVVGSGPDERTLRQYMRSFGVEDSFTVVNRISHHLMPALYRSADLFVAPSSVSVEWEEQFGMVLIESMGCGTPVISTTTGAIPEVTCGYAKLVPCRDPQALAGAISELAADGEKRQHMSSSARTFVEKTYAVPVVVPQLKAILDRV